MKIWRFLKYYGELRLKQNRLLQSLAVKTQRRDTPELAELNALEIVLQAIQAKVFSFFFISFLILLMILGLVLNVIPKLENRVNLDVTCESIEFDTPIALDLSDGLNASMNIGGSVFLHENWDVDFGLSTHYDSPLTLECVNKDRVIQIEQMHIPANSHVSIRRKNGSQLIAIEQMDSLDRITIGFQTDSAIIQFSNTTEFYQETLVNATSSGSGKIFTFELLESDFRWFNFTADNFSFINIQEPVIKGGEDVITSSIIKMDLCYTELNQDTIKLNYHDALEVNFTHPTMNQMALGSGVVKLQAAGVTDRVMGGRIQESGRITDFRPSYWLWLNNTTPPEVKSFVLTVVFSLIAFLFIRQRKNI